MAIRFQDLTRPDTKPLGFHWYTTPSAWKEDCLQQIPLGERVGWSALHHQALTLAEKHAATHGLLFRYNPSHPDVTSATSDTEQTPAHMVSIEAARDHRLDSVYGILLKNGILVAMAPDQNADLSLALDLWRQASVKLPHESWMGSLDLVRHLSLAPPLLCQTSRFWNAKTRGLNASASDIRFQRVNSSELACALQWAGGFARENKLDVDETRAEVLSLIRVGSLFFAFNDAIAVTPFGMIATSGSTQIPMNPLSTVSMHRLSMVFVDPANRNRGLGSQMIEAIHQEIAFESDGYCVLFSDDLNPAAERFYSRLGFTSCGAWVRVKTTGK